MSFHRRPTCEQDIILGLTNKIYRNETDLKYRWIHLSPPQTRSYETVKTYRSVIHQGQKAQWKCWFWSTVRLIEWYCLKVQEPMQLKRPKIWVSKTQLIALLYQYAPPAAWYLKAVWTKSYKTMGLTKSETMTS